jgi:hypothetical protein
MTAAEIQNLVQQVNTELKKSEEVLRLKGGEPFVDEFRQRFAQDLHDRVHGSTKPEVI